MLLALKKLAFSISTFQLQFTNVSKTKIQTARLSYIMKPKIQSCQLAKLLLITGTGKQGLSNTAVRITLPAPC